MGNTRDAPEPPIGSGHAGAMWRQGIAELRGAFFNESNVAQPPQYGLYGTRTPGEIAEARRNEARDLDEEFGSVLVDRLRQADTRDDHGRDTRHLEKE
jgi:hypothetical protein